ncbi:MAG: hypothetical protein EBU66_03570 [Bacteroidetes bacterium]|nr:hypothetical protein [bacterium]NBP63747.1 hypothetical protein [Bacteroidota bacterium]
MTESAQILPIFEQIPMIILLLIGIIVLLIVLKVARSFIKFALSLCALVILALVILKLLNQP